jgi:hypothetical protein
LLHVAILSLLAFSLILIQLLAIWLKCRWSKVSKQDPSSEFTQWTGTRNIPVDWPGLTRKQVPVDDWQIAMLLGRSRLDLPIWKHFLCLLVAVTPSTTFFD